MPATVTAKLIQKENLAGNYWLFVFEFAKRFDFVAGQYVSLKVAPEGTRRSYSIASPPTGKTIEILVDVTPMGPGSKFFLGLNMGEAVEMMGPMGMFTVGAGKTKSNKLFIATGSGIAPIRAMILDLLKSSQYQGEVQLIWGMRYQKDLFWLSEWEELNREFANFTCKIVLSKPGEHWHGTCGHVGDCLRDGFIVSLANPSNWEFYVCGNKEMIVETGEYLASKGMTKEDIHFEKFY